MSDCHDGRKRTHKACQLCRQRKRKCDALESFPKPCSYCADRKTLCSLDEGPMAGSKRTLSLMNESSDNSNKKEVSVVHCQATKSADQVLTQNREFKSIATQKGNIAEIDSGIKIPFDMGESLEIKTDQGGKSLLVPKQRLQKLYGAYITQLHTKFPVVPLRILAGTESDLLTSLDNLLFLTICQVATTVCESDLRGPLLDHVRGLITKGFGNYIFCTPVESLSYIASKLLASYWYNGQRRFQEDFSWLDSGSALHIGMMVGLPQFASQEDFFLSSADNKDLQLTLWLSTLVSNHCWAMVLGLCPTAPGLASFPSLEVIQQIMEGSPDHDYLLQLIYQLRLLNIYNESMTILHSESSPVTRISVVRSFLDLLTSEHTQNVNKMQPVTELTYLGCKILLTSFLLLSDTPKAHMESAVMTLYISLMQLSEYMEECVSGTKHTVLPNFIRYLVVYAVVMLYKLMISEYRYLIKEPWDAISRLRNSQELLKHPSNQPFPWSEVVLVITHEMYLEGKLDTKLCSTMNRRGSSFALSSLNETIQIMKDAKAGPDIYNAVKSKVRKTYGNDPAKASLIMKFWKKPEQFKGKGSEEESDEESDPVNTMKKPRKDIANCLSNAHGVSPTDPTLDDLTTFEMLFKDDEIFYRSLFGPSNGVSNT